MPWETTGDRQEMNLSEKPGLEHDRLQMLYKRANQYTEE